MEHPMSGMINGAPAPDDDAPNAPPNANSTLHNPLLAAAEQKLEAGLSPDNRENYMKVVVAGMAGALAKGPDGILAKLLKNPDPIKAAAQGAVALVLILRRDTKKGVMPIKA